jgi:hypothetical protein
MLVSSPAGNGHLAHVNAAALALLLARRLLGVLLCLALPQLLRSPGVAPLLVRGFVVLVGQDLTRATIGAPVQDIPLLVLAERCGGEPESDMGRGIAVMLAGSRVEAVVFGALLVEL